MSASLVEVKDLETFAYYPAYMKDFDGEKKQILVHYEQAWKPAEWVPAENVRPAMLPHDPTKFSPKVGDDVEAKAKSSEKEPFSWWRASVRSVQGGFCLISYSDWDDSYNEVVDTGMLRPANKAAAIDVSRLAKTRIPLPRALRVDASLSTEQSEATSAANAKSYQDLLKLSKCFSLIEDNEKHELFAIGDHAAINRIKMLAPMHFQHLIQLRELEKRKRHVTESLEETKAKLAKGYVLKFNVAADLVGMVIGKKGANVREAQRIEGVESIKVHPDSGLVTIVAIDERAANEAREKLEFVQVLFPVPQRRFGFIVGPKFAHIRKIEKASGVKYIRAPERQNNRNGRNGRKYNINYNGGDDSDEDERKNNRRNGRGGSGRGGRGGRGGWYGRQRRRFNDEGDGDDGNQDTIDLTILGQKAAVDNAVMLLNHHLNNLHSYMQAEREQQQVEDKLYELVDNYGLRDTRFGNTSNGNNKKQQKKQQQQNQQQNQNQEGRKERRDRKKKKKNNNNNGGDNAEQQQQQQQQQQQTNGNDGGDGNQRKKRKRRRNKKGNGDNNDVGAAAPAAAAASASSGDAEAKHDEATTADSKPKRRTRRQRKPKGEVPAVATGGADAPAAANSEAKHDEQPQDLPAVAAAPEQPEKPKQEERKPEAAVAAASDAAASDADAGAGAAAGGEDNASPPADE